MADALTGVAEGLKGEPVLLAGFGAMLLVEGAGVLRGGTFLLVVSLMLGAYVVSLATHLWVRRPGREGAGAEPRTDLRARGTGRVKVRNARGEVKARLRSSHDIDIASGPAATHPTAPVAGPPAAEPAPPAPPEPVPADPGPSAPADPEPSVAAVAAVAVPPAAALAPEPAADVAAGRYTPSLARARDTVLAAARGTGGSPVHFEIVADSGCGKTLLLDEVAAGLKDDGRLVLFITAGAPQYGSAGSLGPAEREMADYAACRQLIDAIVADVHRAYAPDDDEEPLLDADAGRELETALLAVRDVRPPAPSITANVNLDVRVEDSSHVQVTGVEEAALAAAAAAAEGTAPERPRSRLTEMQGQLTQLLDRFARTWPTALLVDDVHAVAGTPVEQWLLAVLRGLSTAVVVHGRRPAVGEGPATGGRRIGLGLLPYEETTAFVAERLVGAGWQEAAAGAAAEEVALLTRGHPIGVAVCSAIVRDSLPADSSAAEVRLLMLGGAGHWDDDGAFEAVRTYVDHYAAGIVGRPVALFDPLVVLRRCTAPILVAVLGETEGVTERQASRLYDWLSGCAFVTPFDDDVNEGWRLHDYLRENLDRRFLRTRPAEYAGLHATIERHYRAGMNFDAERDEGSWMAAGARYEDPAWQRDSKEWLYHAAHLPRADFESSKRAMIRLFVEAFFWWDTEVPSSYCDQLVAAYRALPADRDLRWVEWLDQLRTGYVAGRTNQAPGRDEEMWEQAAEALNDIAGDLRLRCGRVPADPDLRRIYILHCQLQGDAVWFGSGGTEEDRERAAVWYRASLDACTDEDELWMGNWAAWQIGDLWAGTDPARARALLDGLEDLAADEEDNELPLWLAETFADIAWAENDPRRAFDAYARAGLRALAYHVRQETYGQYPNRYSDSLHRGVLTRLGERERQALDAGLTEEVAAAKRRSRALFAPYWRYVGREPGDTFGIPDPPDAADLGTDLTEFARAAKWVIRHMGDELEKSVEEPLRDPADH
ncbi:hypothetical protein [Streptomyces sp. NPDC049040]|uniref:hypothetical protein n=1 Tax=Streptomyces sp. NPDC049040 TaxID=3365593 RepID=UPI00371E1C6D